MLKYFFPITRPLPWIKDLLDKREKSVALPNSSAWRIWSLGQDRYFMLAIESGIFMEISSEAYQMLSMLRQTGDEKVLSERVLHEFRELARGGVFSTAPKVNNDISTINSLNLNICHNCNISCDYCFAGGGVYGSNVARMPLDMVKLALELLVHQLPEGETANVVLFGGEPLMEKEMVYNTIKYGRSLAKESKNRIIFDVFTNGTLIDETFAKLLEEDTDIRLLISLDGPPDINDNYRHGCGMKGVAGTVQEKLSYLQNISPDRIVVRCTVASPIPDLLKRAEYFSSLGFTNIVFDPAFCQGVEKIPSADEIYRAMEGELGRVSEFLLTKIKSHQKININLLSETISQILMNRPKEISTYVPPCPGGRNYLSIDVFGDIYSCHYFVGNKEFSLGNVRINGFKQRDMTKANGLKDLSREENCKHCHLRMICEGPCPFKRLVLYAENNTVQEAHCRFMEKRFDESLKLLASIYQRENYPYLQLWNYLLNSTN